MELILIWFLTFVAMGEEIKANDQEILQLQDNIIILEKRIQQNDTTILKLSGAHSSFYANQQIFNEGHDHKHSHGEAKD